MALGGLQVWLRRMDGCYCLVRLLLAVDMAVRRVWCSAQSLSGVWETRLEEAKVCG